MIAVIGGTSLLDVDFFRGLEGGIIENKYGSVYLLKNEEVIFVPRHGRDRNIPPHRINHRANMLALRDLEIEKIIGVTSVGSLKKKITPGSIVVPHDYINLWNTPTYFDSEITHITPGLDEPTRNSIIETARKLGIRVIEKGIYAQTTGPRLETKAEINLLKDYADVVGMTMASEATLSRELDLKYASISSVDNYCHGIIEGTLDFKEIIEKASKNRDSLKELLTAVIGELK